MDRSNTPVIAGTLTVISAAFGLLGGLIFLMLPLLFMSIIEASGDPEGARILTILMVIYVSLGALFIVAAVLALIGGIFAFKRTHWGWALTGAIASVISFFPVGIPAVVFTAQSRQEFAPAAPEIADGPVPEKTGRPMTGGVLLLVAAGFSLLGALAMGGYAIFIPDMLFPMAGMPADEAVIMDGMSGFMAVFYGVWGVLMLVAAVLSLVGGLQTLKRRSWAWALAGAIGAVVGFFPVGIAAIILVAQSKDEFTPEAAALPA